MPASGHSSAGEQSLQFDICHLFNDFCELHRVIMVGAVGIKPLIGERVVK